MQRLRPAYSVKRLAFRRFLYALRCTLYAVLFLSAIRCPPSAIAYADVIYLTSGETLKGLVVEEHRDRVVVNVGGKEQLLLRRDVDQIFFDDPERNYLYLGSQALENGDFPLAQGLFRKALQIHPAFQEGVDALHRVEDLKAKQSSSSWSSSPLKALETRWGLLLESTADYPLVREVEEGSTASRLEIFSADQLVSLWSESLGFMPLVEVARVLHGPSESLVKLTIQRRLVLPDPRLVTLSMERLGLTVQAVDLPKAADGAGLKPGDRIVKIQNRSTRYMTLNEARRMLEESRGQGVKLVIHRDLMLRRP